MTQFTSTLDEETEEKPRKRRKRMKELPKEGSSEDGKLVIALRLLWPSTWPMLA